MNHPELSGALKELGLLGNKPSGTSWKEQAKQQTQKTTQKLNTVNLQRENRTLWSDEQEAVIQSNAENIQVIALAGTGKTEMLSAYAKRRPQARLKYLVFNRTMAQEAKQRLPSNVSCATFHGLAFSRFGEPLAHKQNFPWHPHILSSIELKNIPDFLGYAALDLLRQTINRFATSCDESIGTQHIPSSVWQLWKHRDIDSILGNQEEAVVFHAQKLWRAMLQQKNEVPCPPEVWVKMAQLQKASWTTDGWLIDEAQDMSPAMQDWMENQEGIKVMAGDPHQAIYGWRTPGVWPKNEKKDEQRFTLSTSHRFGKEIANLVNATLQRMGAEERISGGGAPGKILTTPPNEATTGLARTQAGARRAAVRAKERGWAISSLPELPERWKAILALQQGKMDHIKDPWVRSFSSFDEMMHTVDEWGDDDWKKACQWAKRNPGEISTEDQGAKSLTLSTIHQAKGQTHERVWILPDVRLPEGSSHQWTSSEKEEARLIYVALTRARKEIYIDLAVREKLSQWWKNQKTVETNPVWDDGF